MEFDVQVATAAAPILTGTPEDLMVLVDQVLDELTEAGLRALATAIAAAAPRDTGALAESFGFDPAAEVGGLELIGHSDATELVTGRVFSTLPYIEVIEDGRLPGTFVSREGLDALTGWAQRKLGATGPDALRAAFAIATAIERRGLPPQHILEQGIAGAADAIEQLLTEAGAAVAERLAGGGA
jgi:hypothetical protein